MKKIILLGLSLFTVVLLQAGSLELYFNGSSVAPGASVQVMGDPTAEYIQAKIAVKNISSTAVDVRAKKIIHANDTLPGTSNYFCWGLCFPPFVYVSPNALSIDPGVTNEEFYGDYSPMTVPGISRVTYVFFNANDANDSIAVVVEFNASPASVSDLTKGVKFSEAYPNPATSVVNVDYLLNQNITKASVVVSNMLGCKVQEIALTEESGRVQIPISELGNGIYFYSLVGNDKALFTRKFVVKR